MRISRKSAGALAIISVLLAAMPAEARPRGGGRSWNNSAYSHPGGYVRYGGPARYYGAYPGYSAYPVYYRGYHGHGDDAALALGVGMLGVVLATAIASRNRGDSGRVRGGHYYDDRSYDRSVPRDYDGYYDDRYSGGDPYDARPDRYAGAERPERYTAPVRPVRPDHYAGTQRPDRYAAPVRPDRPDGYSGTDRDDDVDMNALDPEGYYRNGGRADGGANEGAVGM